MHEYLLNLTAWITNHPNLAGLVIFITSFAESLAFVGLIMPGAAMMLTAGALIATGALSFRKRGQIYFLTFFYSQMVKSLHVSICTYRHSQLSPPRYPAWP